MHFEMPTMYVQHSKIQFHEGNVHVRVRVHDMYTVRVDIVFLEFDPNKCMYHSSDLRN